MAVVTNFCALIRRTDDNPAHHIVTNPLPTIWTSWLDLESSLAIMPFLWIEDKCLFSRMFQISLMNYYINWLIKYNDKHLMTIGQSWEPVHLRVLAIICSTVFISAHPGILYIVVRIPTIHGWSEVRPVPKPKNPKTEYSRVHRFPALITLLLCLILDLDQRN